MGIGLYSSELITIQSAKLNTPPLRSKVYTIPRLIITTLTSLVAVAAVAVFGRNSNRGYYVCHAFSSATRRGRWSSPGVQVPTFQPYSSYYSTTTALTMKNKKGKTIAKQNLPSKVCVVCERPFTWRKKWEANWDEVTTCSKSCNAKRKQQHKQEKKVQTTAVGSNGGTIRVSSDEEEQDAEREEDSVLDPKALKKMLRKQRKESVKAQKQERRLKREGNTTPEVGRKPCDVCSKEVDMLIRCTIDATQQYRMVCGTCWPSVSGGVTDGNPHTHPHYNYGGVWKNRNATQNKRIGDGRRCTK